MSRQNFLFLTFCLVLLVGIMQSYNTFQRFFSPEKIQKHQISELQKKLVEKEILLTKAEVRFLDFQQEVAQALPNLNSIEKGVQTYPLRNLASVSQAPPKEIDLSGVMLQRAKAEFRSKDYSAAVMTLKKTIEKFPGTVHQVEALFFLAESYFLLQKPSDSLEIIEKMMTQFPEHELTGFIMLRMGQILQAKNHPDEAAEVYQTVQRQFAKNVEIRTQAEKLEKAIE